VLRRLTLTALRKGHQQMCCTVYTVLRIVVVQVKTVKFVVLYRNKWSLEVNVYQFYFRFKYVTLCYFNSG
jgi:hypothetical protein